MVNAGSQTFTQRRLVEMFHRRLAGRSWITGLNGIEDGHMLLQDNRRNSRTRIDPLTVLSHAPIEMTYQKNHEII